MKSSPPEPYDLERLGRLLALLRAAPRAWVERAKRIPVAITDRDVAELGGKLDADPTFRKSFDEDPLAATAAAGMPDLAASLRRELDAVVRLAEQGAVDELLSEAPEVVAHRQPAGTRLRALLLRSEAVRAQLRSASDQKGSDPAGV